MGPRAHTTEQRMVQRARVVLIACDGATNRTISATAGLSEQAVSRWRARYAADGLVGLRGLHRSGRPAVHGAAERLRIAATVTTAPPALDSQWTHAAIAEHLADTGRSASYVGRTLKRLDVKVHKVRGWLNRRDTPEFWERAADVCGSYLSPPTNALVLSVDEKTAIAPASPPRDMPVEPGRAARREFEHRRHGTVSSMAALDVATGQVLGRDIDRNDAATLIALLAEIDRAVDPDLEIHLVLDNGPSHVAKATKAWLAEHPRFHAHHTPAHASWRNQIELFLSILTRRLLTRGEFSSRNDLIDKIMGFIADHDATATPFTRTYDARKPAPTDAHTTCAA